jgi:photosynthetic reaction center cytochrome c subunit
MRFLGRWQSCCALALGALLIAGCNNPSTNSVQRGYRGTGMVELFSPSTTEALAAANTIPVVAVTPAGGPAAGTIFKNLKVLGDLDISQFTGLMGAITTWVAPQEGCPYCHAEGDLASDAKYTKVVARRMLQMTREINANWKPHVAATGVTCYTCHRGQPVPANIWFQDPGPQTARGGMVGSRAGQNSPAMAVGLTSLPYDPLTKFLDQTNEIRVMSNGPLMAPNHQAVTIKDAEATYALMMNMSKSLGVNCTYCHNTQNFADWKISTPQRATAWQGIRMVRELNGAYLGPLKPVFPPKRYGPLGDGPKVGCVTCHQGAFKPLFGAPMAKDFPALIASNGAAPAVTPVAVTQ